MSYVNLWTDRINNARSIFLRWKPERTNGICLDRRYSAVCGSCVEQEYTLAVLGKKTVSLPSGIQVACIQIFWGTQKWWPFQEVATSFEKCSISERPARHRPFWHSVTTTGVLGWDVGCFENMVLICKCWMLETWIRPVLMCGVWVLTYTCQLGKSYGLLTRRLLGQGKNVLTKPEEKTNKEKKGPG